MQVIFNSRDGDASGLRDQAVRRVRLAMRRLTWLVPRVAVQFTDVNGPRGRMDKRCQVALRTEGRGTVVATAMARDWRSALDGALARAIRLLLRLCRRDHGLRERGQRASAIER
jgi:siroheme synthase (precorrin-2 oxidase/ferrochelatase)